MAGDDTGARLDEDSPLSAEESLALVEAERARTSSAIAPDPRLLYGVWGLAWLLGFAGLYLASADTGPVAMPPAVAGIAFFLLLLAATVVTGVHMARRFAGVRGVSSQVGAMYGWAWPIGFTAYAAIMGGAQRAGVEGPVMGLLWSAGSGLVVGLLYLAGGALWQDRVQYGLGAWILLASGLGALAGTPGVYLVMSLAGGGGFLLAAAGFALRSARGSRGGGAAT
ncbi:MAG: hypothetical protein ACYCV4_10030 [Dermatophilaceae bacterium]